MGELHTLIDDIDRAIEQSSEQSRTRALTRITNLLVDEEPALQNEQIGIFDDVIGRFTAMIDVLGRADLAERLAALEHGPRNVIRALAFDDEIKVAGPVLAKSKQLDEQDLMEIAAAKGSSHMLAICGRHRIPENVTDVLVSLGDKAVRQAVAGNAGAKLSGQVTATLIEDAREDGELQRSLGERRDLSTEAAQKLVEVVRETARREIMAALPPLDAEPPAPENGIRPPPVPDLPGRDYEAAHAAVEAITAKRPLAETDITRFAEKGSEASAICALAGLTGMPVESAEHVYDSRESDLLLLVSKAHKWSWKTLSSLMVMRDASLAKSAKLRQAEQKFGAVTVGKARRTLQVLQIRGSLRPARKSGPDALKPA